MPDATKVASQKAARPARRYERRVYTCYDVAALRRTLTADELAEWRLVIAFSEAAGLSYVLIFEREA